MATPVKDSADTPTTNTQSSPQPLPEPGLMAKVLAYAVVLASIASIAYIVWIIIKN